jgi:hypothetical protein
MTQSTKEKQERFRRIFPPRVDKLRDQLRILGHCSNKGNYEWDPNQLQRFFAYILLEFVSCARCYGINITASVDGQDIHQYE